MSSYRNYNDLISYRSKSSSPSINISLIRNPTATGASSSTGSGYRFNYSNIGSSSRSPVTSGVGKDRIITGSASSVYRNAFLKRDQSNEDKSLYKYSNLKTSPRSRLNFGKSDDNVQGKSTEKSAFIEKYSIPERKSSERIASVLNKYGTRSISSGKSSEPEITTRYGLDTSRKSVLRENYENEIKPDEKNKKHTDHSVVSYKALRTSETTSSKSSREPSPEINGTKASSSCKVHGRISDYGRSATPTEIPATLKFANASTLASSINNVASQKTEPSSGHFTSERLSPSGTKTIALNPDEKCNKTTVDEVNMKELNLDVKTIETNNKKNDKTIKDLENVKQITVTVVSRATSPTPPASSSFIRIRRADVARTIQKEITKVNKKIETKNTEVQSDRMDDTARYSRFASGTRMSPWPSYLDKFQTSGSYTRSYDSSSKINNFGYNRRTDDRSSSSKNETTSQSNKNIPLKHEPTDNLINSKQSEIKNEISTDDKTSCHEKASNLSKKENSVSSSLSSSPSLSSCRQFSSRSDGVTTPNESKSTTRNSSMKSLKQQRQITRTNSSSSSAVSMPSNKSKSASAGSLTNQSIKIKTTPSPSSSQLHLKVASDGGTSSSISVNTKQCNSLNARGKPPVPKTSDCNSTMKTAPVTKYINKDFRKSALNMSDAGDITRTKYHRKRTKSSQRSLSVSSQESESKDNELSSTKTSSNTCKSSHIPRVSNNSLKTGSNNNISISNLVNFQASRSNSESPPRRKNSACSTASASEKSSELSTSDSSTSENGDEMKLEKNRQRRRRRRRKCSKISTCSKHERKREISLSSSRTSVFALSTDELSLTTDKSHQTYLNPHNSQNDQSTQSEEGKLLLIKTPSPLTHFKSNSDGIKSDNKTSQKNSVASKKSILSSNTSKSITKRVSKDSSKPNISKEKNIKISKRQFSDDKSWLMDSKSDNPSKKMGQNGVYQDESSQETTVSVNLPDDGRYSAKICRQSSGDQAWWLNQDEMSKRESLSPKKNSNKTSSSTSKHKNCLKNQQSGERAWWMSEDPSQVPDGIEVYSPTSLTSPIDLSHDNIDISKGFTEDETSERRANRIRHIESGERAWWMDSNSNIPEGIENIRQDRESSNSDDSSESFEQLDIHRISVAGSTLQLDNSISKFSNEYPTSPIEKYPLGDRISPEGIENSSNMSECYDGRRLPYDNVHLTHHSQSSKSSSYKRPSTLLRYIGNMTNIDDLLGETSNDYNNSVILNVSRKREGKPETSDESSECEEIDVAKVIIHDSTPKTPVIQRRGRDKERPQPDGYIPGKQSSR